MMANNILMWKKPPSLPAAAAEIANNIEMQDAKCFTDHLRQPSLTLFSNRKQPTAAVVTATKPTLK